MDKPANIVGRTRQLRSLDRFLFEGGVHGPLRLGLVSGRKRTGKTQLLVAACEALGGLYLPCVQTRATEPQDPDSAPRLPTTQAWTPPSGTPEPWERLLRAALEVAARLAPPNTPALVVIDEFPYAIANAPQLPSLIQHLYDDSQNRRGPGGRLILCGSALNVMRTLPCGTKPLRGRAFMDMRLNALDYREAARLWDIEDPEMALRVHACVGGIPGYHVLMTKPPADVRDFDDWLVENFLEPGQSVFTRTEVDYLLREDPRITNRTIYHDVLTAVANGANTPSKIGSALGRDDNAVRYPLSVLESAGYLTRSQDLLRGRRPTITVTDPVIRFDRLITAPHLGQLELGRAEQVWRATAPTFRSSILGPHFEELARDWTNRFAPDELGHPTGFGQVGYATIQDHTGRAKHEIDVLAKDADRITIIGEAKATLTRRGLPDLTRLDTIRDLLTRAGHNTDQTILALFSTTGFTPDLESTATQRPDVELINLNRLYGR